MDPTSQYALAYALTTTAGLRGFLTLLAASLAAHFGWIHPAPAFAWLGTNGALGILGAFAILEILGDKVPALDHALQFVHTAVRPVGAAILVGGTIHTESHAQLYGLMAAGALNALIVHGSSAAARAASTVTTGGIANPVLSVTEDLIAVAAVALSFVLPVLAAILAFLFVLALILFARRVALRLHARPPTPP